MAIILPHTSPVFDREAYRIASIRAREGEAEGRHPEAMTYLQWIATMDPHIDGRTHEGMARVSIDRSSRPLRSAGLHEDYISAAELSCAIFNAQPETMRRAEFTSFRPVQQQNGGGQEKGDGHVTGGKPGDSGCVDSASLTSCWWGYHIYLNHCAVNDVALAESAASIGASLSALIPHASALVLGAVSAYLAAESAWLRWADDKCNHGGAFVDGTWVSVGTPWVSTVC